MGRDLRHESWIRDVLEGDIPSTIWLNGEIPWIGYSFSCNHIAAPQTIHPWMYWDMVGGIDAPHWEKFSKPAINILPSNRSFNRVGRFEFIQDKL
jgi:hypothetical protein